MDIATYINFIFPPVLDTETQLDKQEPTQTTPQLLILDTNFPWSAGVNVSIYIYFSYVCVCVPACMSVFYVQFNDYGGQKRALDPQDWHYEML